MVDFNNKAIFKLKEMNIKDGENIVKDILIFNEKVISSFISMRDKLIFTDKRIISVNVKGITGSKVDYTSIPYKKIQTFSIETAGTFDLDAELDILISGMGVVRFEINGNANIKELGQAISNYIL